MKCVAVALMVMAAACGSAKSGATTTTNPVPDSVYTPMPTTPAATTSTAVLTPGTVPSDLIDDCVHFVELGAFLKVPDQQRAWDLAGRNEATQRVLCEVYGEKDPEGINTMSAQYHALQTYMAGITTTTR
jgi:hypothetical protein